MPKFTRGTRVTLFVLACFAALGAFYTGYDYKLYQDLSNLVWVGICVALFILVFLLVRKTE